MSVSNINITVNQILKRIDSHRKFAEDIYNAIHFITYTETIVPYAGKSMQKVIYPVLSHLHLLAFS